MSSTGHGEAIIRTCLAHRITSLMQTGGYSNTPFATVCAEQVTQSIFTIFLTFDTDERIAGNSGVDEPSGLTSDASVLIIE